jgi:hypothetical protein
MADRISWDEVLGSEAPIRLKDMGDGTFAPVFYSANSTGSSGGSSGGVIPGVDTSRTQWLMVVNPNNTPTTITYIKVSDGTSGTPVGGFIPDADQAEWEDANYILNSAGQLASETLKRGSETRTRTWTYTTDGSGNITATPGAWV